MTLGKLLHLLTLIHEAHPEADDAEVWAGKGKCNIRVTYVGYDKKHKPFRIKLEE